MRRSDEEQGRHYSRNPKVMAVDDFIGKLIRSGLKLVPRTSNPYSGAYTTMHPRQANSLAVVAT